MLLTAEEQKQLQLFLGEFEESQPAHFESSYGDVYDFYQENPYSYGDYGDQFERREKRLLTQEEKKRNHIASEQKRRRNIKHGFDILSTLVPEIQESQRSESVILQRCTPKLTKQFSTLKN